MASILRFSAALLALLAAAQVASARSLSQATPTLETKGKSIAGFKFVTDVSSHALLTVDTCAINAAAEAGKFDEAANIYAKGLYGLKSDGALRNLRTYATANFTSAADPTAKLYIEYFKDPKWADTQFMEAINGTGPYNDTGVRAETIKKTAQIHVLLKYIAHELDGIAPAMKTKTKEEVHHMLDEAWALYAGVNQTCSPYLYAERRAAYAGTRKNCTISLVNEGMVEAANIIQAGIDANNTKAIEAGQVAMTRLFVLTYLQGTLEYAFKMGLQVANGATSFPAAKKAQGEGRVFYQVIAPVVALGDAKADQTVSAIFNLANAPTADAYNVTKKILAPLAEALNITAAELGMPNTTQALSCPPPAPPSVTPLPAPAKVETTNTSSNVTTTSKSGNSAAGMTSSALLAVVAALLMLLA